MSSQRVKSRGHMKRGQAFTLIEMVMAISITAIIGMSIAGASMALSTAYENGQDYYQCLQTGRITMARLEQILRKSLLIGGTGPDLMWLWREDTNGDGGINLTEISTIAYDRQNKTLKEIHLEFPSTWPESMLKVADRSLTLYEVTAQYASISSFRSCYGPIMKNTVLAENVVDFTVAPWPYPPITKAIGVTMTVRQSDRTLTVRSAAKLRGDTVDRVAFAFGGGQSGHWVLLD